jgi:hypothetical protein
VSIRAISIPADPRQLAINARVTPEEARTMTLSELAAVKFNREARRDDRFELRMAPAAPQSIRSSAGFPELYRQLIASAGLTLEEASDMTLGEIAVHKFNRYETAAVRQLIPSAG